MKSFHFSFLKIMPANGRELTEVKSGGLL